MNPALKVFANHRYAAKFWFTAFVIMLLCSLVQAVLIISALTKNRKVVILDGANVFHVAPLESYKKALRIKRLCLTFAIRALFSRNPTGFDTPELLKQMFLIEPAMRHVNKDFEASQAKFKKFTIHQKPEIIKMSFTDKGQFLIARAEVGLVMTGRLGSREVRESKKLDCVFTLAKNKRLEENGRLPYVVYDYDIQEISQ